MSDMGTRARLGAFVAVTALVLVCSAAAKDFKPGDLRVCNAARCVAIADQDVLNAVGTFYYGTTKLSVVPRPRMGAPAFELRFRNGYATGIVGSAALDRFLSYGVNLGRFDRGRWYRVPAAVARELRRLTSGLAPLRVTPAALAQAH
jgi:hypothetical protein